jgi:uncharacterized membrane protein
MRSGPGDGVPVIAPARWRTSLALLLSAAGLGLSAYLTAAHFLGSQALVCPATQTINCEVVTTSAQSHILGIPVAVLGLAFYLVVTAINLPVAWRAQDRRVHLARLALIAVGMAFALYLVAAELLIIDAICLWCTSVHVVTFALFVLTMATVPSMLGWTQRPEVVPSRADRARTGATRERSR